MGLLFGAPLALIEEYRSTWIAGRYGGGKTALAFELAGRLLRRGSVRSVLSNYPSVWYREGDVGGIEDCCLVLDEASEYLDGQIGDSRLLSAFRGMRHFGNIVLLPSADLVAKRLRRVIVESIGDYSFMLPLAGFGLFRVFLFRYWIGPVQDPPDSASARRRLSYGWFVYVSCPRDFARFESRHRGRGSRTADILAALRGQASGGMGELGGAF